MQINKSTLENILSRAAGSRILVIGDVMLDKYIWGDTTRISPEAPVPVVKVSGETNTAGGAANVALNIASLGAKAFLFGRIGDDANGRILADTVGRKNVELVKGAISPRHSTIVKTRIVCRRQQVCRLDTEAAADSFRLTQSEAEDILGPYIRECDAVIVSDYAKGIVSNESLSAVRGLVPPGRIIALDPKPRTGISYEGMSVMTPNRAEALSMAGLDEGAYPEFPADEVCRRIHEKFAPDKLVVTLGADGMLVGDKGRVIDRVPTFAREVFDVSGAGDTVISALTLALCTGADLLDAIRFANIAAGFVVGKVGTATAAPNDIREYAGKNP